MGQRCQTIWIEWNRENQFAVVWHFLNAIASYAFYFWVLGLIIVWALDGFSALHDVDIGASFLIMCVLNVRSMEKNGLQVWPFLVICGSKVLTTRFYWGIPLPLWFDLRNVRSITREGETRFLNFASYPVIKIKLSNNRYVVFNTLLGERLKEVLHES